MCQAGSLAGRMSCFHHVRRLSYFHNSPCDMAFIGLNVLFLVLPFAWASHFMNVNGAWPHQLTFARMCLFVPLVTF